MRRLLLSLMAVSLVAGFAAPPQADAQQSINFYIGGFSPRPEDARGTDDVLYQNRGFFDFDIADFDGVTAGGEYLVGLGDNVDAGLGLGIYSRTVPTVYARLVNSDGSEIRQDLKLRIVPFTATLRFLPLGHHAGIVPYVGGGVAAYSWYYSETGQFVDSRDNSIFRGTFSGSGGAVGPVALGGVSVPFGALGVGAEIRWQGGRATLPGEQGFAGSKIDLGGFNYLATFTVRF